MKKIFVLLILIFLSVNTVYAEKHDKDYSVRFNGTKYNLLYSIKNKDFGGYLNEYYKKGETYNIWSEMIAVHHFPNAYSPIDRIKDFKDYLGSMHVPSSLTFDDKKNTAMIDFIMISDHSMPIVIEFNIFKYEKSKKCGSIAIQYARRYTATTTMQIESIKKDVEKNRNKLIQKVKHFEIPEVITKDIDKCISAADITEENKPNTAVENVVTEEIAENKSDGTTVTTNEEQKEVAVSEEKQAEQNKEVKEEETDEVSLKEEPQESIKTNIPEEENVAVKTDKKPDEENIIKESATIQDNSTTINKKTKKSKEDNYEIINTKDEYIAVPRTKKELKEEVKTKRQLQKEKKIQLKQKAKEEKKQVKIDKKTAKQQEKISRKEIKKAEKSAKKTYTVSNNNSDLIAKPRTKKELKENNKKLKKEAKERVKKAKKNLE